MVIREKSNACGVAEGSALGMTHLYVYYYEGKLMNPNNINDGQNSRCGENVDGGSMRAHNHLRDQSAEMLSPSRNM